MVKKEKHSPTHAAHPIKHATQPKHHAHEHKQQEHHQHHEHHTPSAPHHVTHVTHVHPTAVDHSKTLEEKLVHNLVELQKVHADLAEKFTKLSDQIAGLLRLFELSAQAFAKQVNLPNVQKDSEFLDKIDKLLDQNKTIAKGLMLMEEKIRGRIGQPEQPTMQPIPFQQRSDVPRPLPRF